MQPDSKKRIGILRGGTGENYQSSIDEGGELIAHIFENLSDKFKVFDILVDKNGVWHIQGISIKPGHLAERVDTVWDTTHSKEFATLQNLGIPTVGVTSFSSLLKNNRPMLEEHLREIGVKMPKSILLPLYQKDFDGPKEEYAMKKARSIFEKFTSPWIVRSYPPDQDMGIHVAKTFGELVSAIEDGITHGSSILVEELISGKIASLHSVAGFRGEHVYNMPLIEVRDGYIHPTSNFSSEEKIKLSTLAKDIYKHLGAIHYLNSNFVWHPKRGVYLTRVSFSPTPKDLHFIYSCESVGIKPHHIFEHILDRAL